jgi:hypothetical protein
VFVISRVQRMQVLEFSCGDLRSNGTIIGCTSKVRRADVLNITKLLLLSDLFLVRIRVTR